MNNVKEFDVTDLLKHLNQRPKDCHKGHFGRVLIVGGNKGYSGAARLAGEAALRVGAGAVAIATHPQHANILNASCPELMCHAVTNGSDLEQFIQWSSFIVAGPGLGTDEWALSLLKSVLIAKNSPLLLDADALNLLSMAKIKTSRHDCIYTPHPGEAARLLNMSSEKIQHNRLEAIGKLSELLGGIIVLKGAGTLVMSKTTESIEMCAAGNPGMATAGMGDVLSGIIAGFAAQHIPLTEASKLGVLIHAMAGDLSAAEQGERGMIASDIIGQLRSLVNIENT